MVAAKDLSGQVFGRLTVYARHPENTSEGKARWICKCECGSERVALAANLKKGFTKSCGCLKREINIARSTTHGHAKRNARDPTYVSWSNMRTRCHNTTNPKYRRYGGMGVSIDPRWDDFTVFLSDLGPRPEGTTLDRIDPYGNYEPKNCRWATPIVQAHNQRRHHLPPEQAA